MDYQRRDLRHKVLGFVARFVQDNGYAPTCAEIREAVGLSSRSHAAYYLRALEREGYIQRKPRSPRGLCLVHGHDSALFGHPFDAWSPAPIHGVSRRSSASDSEPGSRRALPPTTGTDHNAR